MFLLTYVCSFPQKPREDQHKLVSHVVPQYYKHQKSKCSENEKQKLQFPCIQIQIQSLYM